MHKNQLDKIRILAALVVIFSHHYPLTGTRPPAWLETPWLNWSMAGGVGVMVFFCISGYLVTLSWYKQPEFAPFLWKRILRLWPGMLGSVICGIFLFGLIFTTIPLGEYLKSPATWNFFWTNISLTKEYGFLPGVFKNNPNPEVMNGVYWTIPMEFTCYLILAGLGATGLLNRKKILKGFLLIYMASFLLFYNSDFTGIIRHWVEYPAFFAAGAFIALHKNWFSKNGGKLLLFIAPVLVFTYFFTPYPATSRFFLIPALVIFIGNLPAKNSWFTRLGDPSYGIYLYGYPIAQSITALWPEMNFWASLFLTFALSVIAGYASWLLLESRALRWKDIDAATLKMALGKLFRQFWPILPCWVGLRFIVLHLDSPSYNDAENLYLPIARALLDQDWNIFFKPETYYAAPLAYLWPALWGADPTSIRIANMGLWVGCVWFMWRSCLLLGGARAAAFAMVLMLSPELMRFFPSELTEPIYLFSLLGWMHALARILVGHERTRGVIAQAACMLTICLLSRPVLQLIAPAMLLACLVGLVIARNRPAPPVWQPYLPTIALSLSLGLIFPIMVIIKNGLIFGLWGLSSGAGIGLYLGMHPLFQGAEPAFLGFQYDINLTTMLANVTSAPHSIAGDAIARGAAVWQLQSMPLADAATFFFRKLWWWLAHHPEQVEHMGSTLRKLRLFELSILIVACFVMARKLSRRRHATDSNGITPEQWLLAAFMLLMFSGMLAQLMPILYNSRYSATILDPWLIPLAAFGLTYITQPISLRCNFTNTRWSIGLEGREANSLWSSFFIFLLILAMTFSVFNLARKRERVAVDPIHMGPTQTIFEISDSNRIDMQNLERHGDREWIMTQSTAALLVKIHSSDIQNIGVSNILNALWDSKIAVHTPSERCEKVETAYQLTSGTILQPTYYKKSLTLKLRSDGRPQRIVTHANNELRPQEPGYLRLVFHCPAGSRISWFGTRFLASHYPAEAAANANH